MAESFEAFRSRLFTWLNVWTLSGFGRVICIFACAILLASSVAKLFSFHSTGTSNYLAEAWPRVVLVVSGIEAVVAAGLLFDRFGKTFVFASSLLFGAFAILSGTLMMNGVTSCGCFGAIDTSVAGVFAMDLALSLGLGVVLVVKNWSRQIRWNSFVKGFAAACVLLTLSFVLDLGHLPDAISRPLAKFRGDHIVVDPQALDLGVSAPRDVHEFRFMVSNLTDRSRQILGGLSSGSWELKNELPIAITPYGKTELTVAIRFPNNPGLFADSMRLYVEGEGPQVLRIPFRGLCREERTNRAPKRTVSR